MITVGDAGAGAAAAAVEASSKDKAAKRMCLGLSMEGLSWK
jgi:hypothetical protein